MPSIIIERGQGKGFSYDMRPGDSTTIGRDPVCEIVIADPAASRRHFRIRQEGGIWFIADLESRNCTYLNEAQLVAEQRLAFGDRIQVGETVFSFLEEADEKGKKGGLNGKVIGGYLILERVGRGGMGTVYKARQISLNREVALKILSSKYAKDPEFVEQFVAEARAAGQLNHPNVVQVFDVGQAGGLHFFSMEFMDNEGVQDLLANREDGRVDWTEALPMILDAAQGLVFAEKRGIIHRDIKPDNLMRTGDGTVKIGDLGLARHTDDQSEGKVFGTPHFVSPEQAQGKRLTHAADLYSLGATFYRMVVGTTPFTGATVKEILRKQILEDPVPISDLVDDFPPDLEVIIKKLMAKKVEDRYQSATDLLEDLQAFKLAHQIELAGGRKSSKPLLVVVGLLLLALAAVVGFVVTRPDPEPVEPEKIYIKDPDSGNPPVVPTIDPAKEQERIETAAEVAYFRLQRELGDSGNDADIKLKERAQWEASAKAYDELVAQHPDSKVKIKEASTRAKQIRARLDALQTEFDNTVTAAKEWWGRTRGDLQAKEASTEWAATIAYASAMLNSDDASRHLPHLADDGARAQLEGTQDRVVAAAQQAWKDLRTRAESQLTADAGSALSSVTRWAQKADTNAGGIEALTALVDAADAWVDDKGAEVRASLEEALASDKVLFVEAARGIRHPLREGGNGDAGGGSNAVFQYDFARAATEMEQAAGRMRTYAYQDRARAVAADQRALAATWAEYIELLGGGRLFGSDDPIQGLEEVKGGAKATLLLEEDKRPTTSSVWVKITFGAGSSPRSFEWGRRFKPHELASIWVQPKLRDLSAGLALGFARVFAELGEGQAARLCLARAAQGGAGSAVERQVIESEVTAILEYSELVASQERPPRELMKAIDLWRERHALSSFALLVDRRPAAQMPSRLPTATEDEFFANWGQRPQ